MLFLANPPNLIKIILVSLLVKYFWVRYPWGPILLGKGMSWEVIDTGQRSAAENMRIDGDLLDTLAERQNPILHFYDWKGDCATYGYFVDPADYLDLKGAERRGLSLARRPTGGGIIFHVWDLAFSVLVPATHPGFSENTLENYAFVNGAVLAAAKEFLGGRGGFSLIPDDADALDASCERFCMARPTKYDVMLEGRKIAGAAQRKSKAGFLHQGSFALLMPPREYLEDLLVPGTRVLEAMQAATYPLLAAHTTQEEFKEARAELRLLLKKHLTDKE